MSCLADFFCRRSALTIAGTGTKFPLRYNFGRAAGVGRHVESCGNRKGTELAWYLRKSVSLGPIRLNLSKSGIGTSVGVTGFRVGVRPNGSSYIHAGRHGLYMREELGGRRIVEQQDAQPQIPSNAPPTQVYATVCTSELSTPERKELLDRLNKSYKDFRTDYLVIVSSVVAFVVALLSGKAIAILILAVLGTVASIAAAIWESKRRTVKIEYNFEADDTSSYSNLVNAVNTLAKCRKVWAYINARSISSLHESKVNAGASSLISRTTASIGTGTPPWVEANITIPTITARGTTVYFLPDCLLIYDSKGVGCAKHEDLQLSAVVERFIESETVPPDSTVVDSTWKFANKKGGPDRRFNNNVQIPICLYGVLNMSLPAGLLFLLQTSTSGAPREFNSLYSAYISAAKHSR